MPQLLPYQGSGKSLPENCVVAGKARLSVLGPGLLRLEYSETGVFEDRASWFAVCRNQEAQAFTKVIEQGKLCIETTRLRLEYTLDSTFSASNLKIDIKGDAPASWHPGLEPKGNLGGTIRTLDEVEGPRDLGLGLLSRDGWALVDDSTTVLFTDEVTPWATERPKNGNLDWYFFAYGLDYKAALADLTSVGGKIPLPPKFALGSWYSRYWPYTSEEFLEISEQYKKEGFPLDVMVIDMDWHEDGWTGYTWNKKLIPDPKKLLKELHERGLKVTLNLHPHDGVQPHEESFKRFIKALGLPEDHSKSVPFEISDEKFAAAYFRVILNPLENDGVDFWWMDWQQGSKTKVEGLDPLMWLNYLHFRDRQRVDTATGICRRGLNFSRWAGLGDHRHPVHFSGDTHSNWEVLEFLAPFTATAGNVGAAYWSHDMGGHFATAGRTDPELFTRWIQFGAFSPVLRVHSTRDKDNDRRPWLYGEPYASAVREAYQLRDQLAPYLYTAARHCYDTGVAPLRPMYLEYPREDAAYECPHQFMFGPDVLVAPAARPGFGAARVVHVPIWFPEGEWYHLLTHQRYVGPCHTLLALPLEGMAVFARGGAPIPMKGGVVRLYPGKACERELYEDDGESAAYQDGVFKRTKLISSVTQDGQTLFEGPMPAEMPVGTSAQGIDDQARRESERQKLALRQSTEAGNEDALRVMAGISIMALAKPGSSPSTIRLELEVRREIPVAVDCVIAIRIKDVLTYQENRRLVAKTFQILNFDLSLDYGSVAGLEGELDFSVTVAGTALTLHEAFAWNAGCIRDWLVLGPLEAGKGPNPLKIAEAKDLKMVYPRLAGGEAAWTAKHFDPAGVMRGIREFYDFEGTFVCPKGEAFALSMLLADQAGPVTFGFGHEGQGSVWINGEAQVVEAGTFRADLKKGRNLVLVQLCNMIRSGGGFGLSVKESSGTLRFQIPDLETATLGG